MLIGYVLIVARSTFQSHCRALAMCRDISLFFNLRFTQPLNWCELKYYKLVGSNLTGGRAQLHCDLTQSQFFICVHIFYILSVYIVSLTVHFYASASLPANNIYTKHEKYFKGLVIILISWCPPIGWCPRALAQSCLWIIRPWCHKQRRLLRTSEKELMSKEFGLHKSSVRQIVYKWRKFKTTVTFLRSGRPTKITTKQNV